MSDKPDKGRTIRDAEDARAVLTQIPDSGLALAAFCDRHGINRWSLYHWRAKLTRQRLNKPEPKKTTPKKRTANKPVAKTLDLPPFAEVKLPVHPARYEICAPSGWTVRVDDHFQSDRLADLLKAIPC